MLKKPFANLRIVP